MDKVYQSLQFTSATRVDRQKTANQILTHPEQVPLLLHHCFSNEKDISHRACWVLEFVCHRHIKWLLPELDNFISGIKELKNESSIRPMARICEILSQKYAYGDLEVVDILTQDRLLLIVTQCFDWLIGDHKVAPKVYSMQTLYYLKDLESWITPQLRHILLEQRDTHSAAYKARSKNILQKLNK